MNTSAFDDITLDDVGWNKVPTDIIDKSVTDLMDLSGRVAVVTGAGGDCLGQALCHRLAGLGTDIALVGRTEAKLEAVAREVEAKWGVRTHCFVADLMDFDVTERCFKEIHEYFGKIDILVNNANYTVAGQFQNMTEDQISACVNGPYTSIIYATRHCVPYMIADGGGKIVNISSEASRRAHNVALSLYGASKSGVNGLTRSLADELAPYGIIVNAVAPGVMFKKQLRDMFTQPTKENLPIRESMVGTVNDTILKRVSIPEEVANTVAFLCTDACSYIAGQTIMNGGGSVV
ncbi:MAG: SDR family NAD(P)-dependent oxidoreductase [Coriobacteriales bacterium]|jgi:3-oxoacyl-[acyl-carrier protein] reductase